jgi:hypothetical protein
MKDDNYKWVWISEHVRMPIPLDLSSEQEAELIRKAQANPLLSEAEYLELKDLLEHPEKRVPFASLLEEFGIKTDEPPATGEVA